MHGCSCKHISLTLLACLVLHFYFPFAVTPGRKKRDVADCSFGPLCSPVPTEDGELGVSLVPCLAGIIENITPTFGTTHTNIELSGSNFLTASSCIEITVGDYPCDILGDATDSSITCNIQSMPDDMNPISSSRHHAVRMRQGPYGYCLLNQDSDTQRNFYMKPSVTGVSPTIGSIMGGTDITIEGEGFVIGETSVSIDGFDCTVTDVSYTSVECTTQVRIGASQGTVEVGTNPKRDPKLGSGSCMWKS